MTWSRPPKTAHSNTPHMSTSRCGEIHRPNVYTMKEGLTFILAVVLFLPRMLCSGDAVFHCESESTLFGLSKEDTTRNQGLSYIYNTAPEQLNTNIRVFYGGLFPEPGRVVYNMNTMNGCEHYKVGQFQLRKDSLALLTQSTFRYSKLRWVLSCVE